MKKQYLLAKLLCLSLVVVSFASCGDDRDIDGTTHGTGTEKTYPVKISLANFTVEQEEMGKRAGGANTEKDDLYDWLVYDIFLDDDTKGLAGNYFKTINREENESISDMVIEEDLPAGKYIFSIAYVNTPTPGDCFRVNPTSKPTWFDYFFDELERPMTNGEKELSSKDQLFYQDKDVYFKNVKVTVSEGNNSLDKVELEPMWSDVTVNITDAATLPIPEDANRVTIYAYPYYIGFYLNDPTLPRWTPDSDDYNSIEGRIGTSVSVDEFKNGIFPTVPVSVQPTTRLYLCFYTYHDDYDRGREVAKIQVYNGAIETGKNITLKGAIGNALVDDREEIELAIVKEGLVDENINFDTDRDNH